MYIRIMTRTKLRQILPQMTKMALVLDDSDIEMDGDGDPLKLGVEKVGVVKLTKILMNSTYKKQPLSSATTNGSAAYLIHYSLSSTNLNLMLFILTSKQLVQPTEWCTKWVPLCGVKIVADSPTCWNSTYMIITQLQKYDHILLGFCRN